MKKIILLKFFETLSSKIRCCLFSEHSISNENVDGLSSKTNGGETQDRTVNFGVKQVGMSTNTTNFISRFFYPFWIAFLLFAMLPLSAVGQGTVCTGDPVPSNQPDLRATTSGCTANDVQILSARLDGEGCVTCSSDSQVLELDLLITVYHNTSSDRPALSVFGDLTTTLSDGTSSICSLIRASGPLVPKNKILNGVIVSSGGNGIQTINFGKIKFICGSSLKLDNILVAWTVPNEVPIGGPMLTAISSKCDFPQQTLIIAPPLRSSAVAVCDGQLIDVTLTVEGGVGDYTYLWSNGDKTKDLDNVAPGTYSVVITDGEGCTTTASTTLSVCCTTPVIANKIATICSGDSFSVLPPNAIGDIVPAGTTYIWTAPVSNPLSAITGGSAQAIGAIGPISQTLTNTTNASATLTYTVTPKSEDCTGASFTIIVTVNPKPSIVNQTPAAVCSPGSVTLGAADFTGTKIIPAGTTYSWALPVASGITGLAAGTDATSFATGTLTNTTASAITAIYTVTPKSGECTGSSFTVSVVLNPKPSIVNQTPAAVCSPGSVTLGAADFTGTKIIPAGTTYSWALPVASGITGLAAGTDATSFATGTLTNTTASAITAIYTVTPKSGECTGSSFTVSVVLNPKPSIVNQTPAAVCSPGSVTLGAADFTGTNIIPTGTTYSWVLPVAAGITGLASGTDATSFATGTLTNTTNAAITVTYTVTPKSGACTGSSFTVSVVVNPKPSIANQTPAAVCSPGSVTLGAADFTGTNIIPTGTTYSWALPVAAGITGLASGTDATSFATGTLTNTTNAAITVTYTVTPKSGACTGSSFTVSVVVNPKPSIANQTPAAVCSPGSVTLGAADFTGTNIIPTGTTYSWALPVAAGITGLASGTDATSFATGTLTNTTNAAITVTYTVTPKSGACTGSSFTVSVVVNPKPSIANQTPAAVCSPGSVTLGAADFTGTNIIPTGTTYSWVLPVAAGITGLASGTDATSFATGTLTNTTNAAITVTYTVTPKSGACTGSSFTVSVVVNPKPSIANQTPAAVCSPGSVTLGAADFTGTNIIPTGTTYSWALPVAAGITGLASGTDATSFATGTLTNTTNAAITVTYTVTPKSGACTGSSFTVSVVVNPKPSIANQTPAAVCSPGSVTLGAADFTGTNIIPTGTTYSWVLPVSAGITGLASGTDATSFATGTLTNTTNAAITVTYTVTPKSGACTGSSFTVSVVVNPKPSIANQTPAAVCSPGSVTLGAADFTGTNIIPTGTTYSWALPVSAGITGLASGTDATSFATGTLTNTTNAAITVTYTVTPKSGICTGASFTITVTVKPKPVIIASNNGKICSPGTLVLSATYIADATYAWTGPNSFSSTSREPSIVNATPQLSGTYHVIATLNGCASDEASTVVEVENCDGLIYPTQTSCSSFLSNQQPPLDKICYTVSKKGNKSTISNATPGVFFYYASIIPESDGDLEIQVLQFNTASPNIKAFAIQQDQVFVFDENCAKIATGKEVTSPKGSGQAIVTVPNAIGGQTYVISVKYDTKTIVGQNLPSVDYQSYFIARVNGVVVNSTAGNILVSNCSAPTAPLAVAKTTETVSPIEAKIEIVGFDAYPVPFKDQLTIKYKFDYKSDVKIEVFNAQGRSVLSKTDTNSYLNKEVTLTMKVSKEQEQVYVVKVTTDQGTFTKKVMSSK